MPPTVAELTHKPQESTSPRNLYLDVASLIFIWVSAITMTNSLMRLANLPFKTDVICRERARRVNSGCQK